MKKKWVKPEMKFVTDPDIVLECLFEVYQKEMPSVLSGKDIRHTIIYPFLKMLERTYENCKPEELHKDLWSIYQEQQVQEKFVKKSLCYLEERQNKNPVNKKAVG